MFSSPIGIQAINRGYVGQVSGRQAPQGVDVRVQALGKRLGSSACRNQPRVERSRSFSPLRFLWWASLLLGARAQQTTPFPASMNLSSLSGTDGFVLNVEQANVNSGGSVASAGDVNGDGIADLVIGAPDIAGKSYVVFGRAGLGASGSLALSSLNGTNGFVLNGEARDGSGNSVASAGDVNDDGIADLAIGAFLAAPDGKPQAGKSYVVFGRAGLGSGGSLSFSSLNEMCGFVLNGQAGDESGSSVASAGDVNGDGIVDLVIGARYAPSNTIAGNSYAVCYAVFGRNMPISTEPGNESVCASPIFSSTRMKPSLQTPITSSPSVSKSSAINVPLIAGIAGGAGGLTLSIIAGVVAFLRKRSKTKNKNLEGKIPLPKSAHKNEKDGIATPVGQLYAGFGQVNQASYNSARFNPQEGHYEDPNKWAKELQNNPPRANYVGVNDLDVPPRGKSAAKAPAKIHLAGYEHIPMEGHYSDPNEWANRLQNNPPQPNYVNVNSLESAHRTQRFRGNTACPPRALRPSSCPAERRDGSASERSTAGSLQLQ